MNILLLVFNSNFFIAIIALIVGGFAIGLYIVQKKDYKRDVANIILMEIRRAERVSDQIKLSGIRISENMENLLPTNNWVGNNYLFIRDLDRDELDLVNNFYNQCSIIDSSLSQMSNLNNWNRKVVIYMSHW